MFNYIGESISLSALFVWVSVCCLFVSVCVCVCIKAASVIIGW